MKLTFLPLLAVCLLPACREDVAALPSPVDINAESAGFYCQMALLEHVGPKGQTHLDGMPAPLFFSQVKDAVAYLHMPEQSHAVSATYVQDMTAGTWDNPGAWILAENAIYVIGSDVMGGMEAPEFVPFSSREAAIKFSEEHGGELREFSAITTEDVLHDTFPDVENSADDNNDIASRLSALD